MARKDVWTTISIKKDQFNIIDEIHQKTRLDKHDIIDIALMEKFPEFYINK